MTKEKLIETLQKIGIDAYDGGDWLRAKCPFHDDTNPSWGINVTQAHHPYSCFGCKAKGNLYRLLVTIGRYSHEKAAKIAPNDKSDQITDIPELARISQGKLRTIPEDELYPFTFDKVCENWFKRRGISAEVAKRAGCLHHTGMRRILYPWRFEDQLLGVTARTLDPLEKDMKTLPLFNTKKGKLLYLPTGKLQTSKPLVLVEGETSALSLVQAGYRNVAAPCFGSFTVSQKNFLISNGVREIILFFDFDISGLQLTKDVTAMAFPLKVSRIAWTRVVREFSVKVQHPDPNDLSSKQINYALENAVVKNCDFPSL